MLYVLCLKANVPEHIGNVLNMHVCYRDTPGSTIVPACSPHKFLRLLTVTLLDDDESRYTCVSICEITTIFRCAKYVERRASSVKVCLQGIISTEVKLF